jgi:hypothetical protein
MNLNILNLKIITLDKLMATYSITKTNKLIDLNGDKTNFVCSFECRSENEQDFYVAVADQTTLDNEEDAIQYKKSINGVVSSTFTSDNNIYQNHFLVLKSDEPCDVFVTINLKELPKKLPTEEQIKKLEMIKQQIDEEYTPDSQPVEKKYNWTRIFFVCLVIIGILSVVYYFYSKRKQTVETNLETKIDNILKLQPSEMDLNPVSLDYISSPVEASSPVKPVKTGSPVIDIDYDTFVRSPSPVVSPVVASSRDASPENSISKKIHEKLMEKLKKASIAY